ERANGLEPPSKDKRQALPDQMDYLTNIMTGNIRRIFGRRQRLEDLIRKSEDLRAAGQIFKRTSQTVAHTYWWKNVKLVVVIVVVVLIIILIIILLATGVIPVSSPPPPLINPTTKP
ncbi:hypothetical protein NHX12_016691, partial [Muraenolepis orangiensis]